MKNTSGLMKRSLASLCTSQPLTRKEDPQGDKDISLEAGVVCSGLYWGSLEAVLLGEGIKNS